MSYSVPTSPAVSRSTKAQPLTPQRPPHAHQQRSLSFCRSPLTPSTSPYTPISLRSVDSNGSSTLTTPDNSGISARKRLAFTAGSPEVARNGNTSKDRSLADLAKNWRSRSSSANVKAGYVSQDHPGYLLDESSDISILDTANDSSIISNSDEALLAAPFLSTHRKLNSVPAYTTRPRAQSHASLPSSRVQPSSPSITRNINSSAHISSPVQSRTAPRSCNASLISTPPPNRALARQLKAKGSLTDPPQPRRREALGTVTIPSNNASTNMTLEPNTSLDLFDIDENELEYEHDYQGPDIENSFSHDLQPHQLNSFGYPAFPTPLSHQSQPQFGQSVFGDPFHPGGSFNDPQNGLFLNSIGENVEHHFHAARQQPQHLYFNDSQQPLHAFFNPSLPPRLNQVVPQVYQPPVFVPISGTSVVPSTPISARPTQKRSISSSSTSSDAVVTVLPTDCSVCLAAHPVTLAILQPCGHPLCSACLTSALNIVGEKDVECAVCKQGVADFKLVMGTQKVNANSKAKTIALDAQGFTPREPLFPPNLNPLEHGSTHDNNGDLENAFEFGLDFGELRASTPKTEQQIDRSYSASGKRIASRSEENVVLRIDNVPWDITPSQISRWLQQPVERVHVLLDYKGKTLSHAYVEVKDAATAGAILRGEVASSSGKKERGSVLGRGRRARGVTITRSGQSELMKNLFPHWRGAFDGSQPSLAGLQNDRVICALEGGLMTEDELAGLLQLIREPDSHFLKVPCLPFHSLISLLSKFPADVDSRVFWSTNIRDVLFDATCIAIQVLHGRVEQITSKSLHDEEYTLDLAIDLFHSALRCKAFTSQQTHRLTQLGQAVSLPTTENSHSGEVSEQTSQGNSNPHMSVIMDSVTSSPKQMSEENRRTLGIGSLDELAKEFGVDTQVVQALAQRLSKLH